MLDAVYVVVIVGFFALMLAFVRGLDALGRGGAAAERETP
jgi:hypothetical protein